MPIRLRTAAATDLPAITSLYAQEARDHVATYEYVEPDEAEMTRRSQAVVAQGYPYLVAELDGCFAGYAYASSYRTREGYRWTVEDTVYVHPGHTGCGVGRALLQRLIDDCTALDLRQMIAVAGLPHGGRVPGARPQARALAGYGADAACAWGRQRDCGRERLMRMGRPLSTGLGCLRLLTGAPTDERSE